MSTAQEARKAPQTAWGCLDLAIRNGRPAPLTAARLKESVSSQAVRPRLVHYKPGLVDISLESDQCRSKMQENHKTSRELLVASENASVPLDFVGETFDDVAFSVADSVIVPWLPAIAAGRKRNSDVRCDTVTYDRPPSCCGYRLAKTQPCAVGQSVLRLRRVRCQWPGTDTSGTGAHASIIRETLSPLS